MFDSENELRALYEEGSEAYREAIDAMILAVAMGDKGGLMASRERLADVMAATMGSAEAVGALHTLQGAAKAYGEMGLDPSPRVNATEDAGRRLSVVFARVPNRVAKVQFKERLQDLVERTPVTIKKAAERTAQRIAELYGKARVLGFVRSAEEAVTNRVAALLAESVRKGLVEREAGVLIKMGVDSVRKETAAWSEAYSRTVFRTNLNTATAAGRFRQLQDVDVAGVIPALMFQTAGDVDVRHNHAAANGMILSKDNPAWGRLAPPLGYNCRCTVSYISAYALKQMGRLNSDGTIREDAIPREAFPDPGFRHGGRPDLFMREQAS